MIRTAHPMGSGMGWSRHHGPGDLERLLAGLPGHVTVHPIGGAHLVLGPAGAQVVAIDDGTAGAARAVARLASVVRSALAERVSWVPYVHALLVTESDAPCPPATPIPLTLLARALVEGPATVRPTELARLVSCIERGALEGLDGLVAPPQTSAPQATAH